MSPPGREESGRQKRKQQREWRKKATAHLDFKSMAELSKVSGVNEGDLSSISRGARKPSDSVADKLIRAIQKRNYAKGWTYIESAYQFQEAFNYLRSHFSAQSGRRMVSIVDADIDRWYASHLTQLSQAQTEFDSPLNVVTMHSSTEELLSSLLTFLKGWEMKHDFGYLGKVKQKFEDNKFLIIVPAIKRGMQEDGHYDVIRAIYTEMRHIAHLCGAFDLVREMSLWLSTHAKTRGDLHTELQAKVSYAWMLTSRNTQVSLYEAQKLIKEINTLVSTSDFLTSVSIENMDVVAILAELRVRLAIRLDKQRYRPLGKEKFEQLLEESRELLTQPASFGQLCPRLRSRYSLPLDYQHGVYLYQLGDYEESQTRFEAIIEHANYIGWIRVEQAAYSWLATLFEVVGDRDRCSAVLDKIAVPYLPKRQLICQHIRARIMDSD